MEVTGYICRSDLGDLGHCGGSMEVIDDICIGHSCRCGDLWRSFVTFAEVTQVTVEGQWRSFVTFAEVSQVTVEGL